MLRYWRLGKLSSIADYLVLASGRSDKQTQAIAESVRQGLKKFGKALDIEGMKEGNWIVIDYGDVIVHVFQEEVRRHYNLDELWAAAPHPYVSRQNISGKTGIMSLKIHTVWVRKTQEEWVREGIEEYAARIGRTFRWRSAK